MVIWPELTSLMPQPRQSVFIYSTTVHEGMSQEAGRARRFTDGAEPSVVTSIVTYDLSNMSSVRPRQGPLSKSLAPFDRCGYSVVHTFTGTGVRLGDAQYKIDA